MRVLVLCGGESAERVVSLSSGDAVAMWLAEAGHQVTKYDPEAPGVYRHSGERMAPDAIGLSAPQPVAHGEYQPAALRGLLDALDHTKPDVVFPILHGGRGEDGTLQAMLSWCGVPFTGSNALACGLAMNKHHARLVFKANGVPVTDGFVVPFEQMSNSEFVRRRISNSFGYPAVIKPLNGGSTVGLTKVHQPDDVAGALAAVSMQGDEALVEANFNGRKIAATVVCDEAYPLVEIKPKAGFYDYANKYTAGRTDYICPAEISPAETELMRQSALTAFRALGCAGFSRVDLLLGANGEFVCLELNTLPGMTAHSLVPKAARAKGETPPELMQKILEERVSERSEGGVNDDTRRSDERFMRMALREAAKGMGFVSPNPLVGAVAVKNEQVIGKAYHRRFGEAHAEIALLEKLSAAEARGATIYVNLEPCCHLGKTPPCTDALIRARVARVVVGHEDPNPLVGGKGISQLRTAGIEVAVGVLEPDARRLNAPFLTYMTQGRPWILLKVAQSLDGRIALANGQSRWITGEKSRTEVHKLRAQLDAVMVGSQTVLDDDPELTVRHIEGRDPYRIIVDSRLRISPRAKVLRQADRGRTWVIATPEATDGDRRKIEDSGAKILICPAGADQKVELKAALRMLAERGITSLFVEGGGTLHASFIRAGLYDRFIVAVAAKLIGADGRPAIWDLGFESLDQVPQFVIRRNRRIGKDIWLELEPDVYGNR